MSKKILILLLFFVCLLFVVAPLASARLVPECNGGPCELCDFFRGIKLIFDFLAYNLAPPVAGAMFLIAGALFLVSGGSEERISQAKKIFINTFLGLLVVYCSWLIVNSVIQVIGKDIEGFKKETWYKFECTP